MMLCLNAYLAKSNPKLQRLSKMFQTLKKIASVEQFLGDLMRPHIIKDTKLEHKNLAMFIDAAVEGLMKSILHGIQFQALESAWRSVREAVFGEEYDEESQFFYLVNTNRDVLENAAAGDTHFITELGHHIQNTEAEAEAYNAIVGNYQFSTADNDIVLLNYLASIAQTHKCQFVGSTHESLIGESENYLLQQFRQTSQASHVALSYPQILLCIPYGKTYDEVDAFAFEEFSQAHQHDKLLWGSSAFACARLLIRQYHGKIKYDGYITCLCLYHR